MRAEKRWEIKDMEQVGREWIKEEKKIPTVPEVKMM